MGDAVLASEAYLWCLVEPRASGGGMPMLFAILLLACPQAPEDSVPAVAGCGTCHTDAAGHGIEDAHPAQALTCVDCHGGDETAATLEAAHVQRPADIDSATRLKTLSSVELDAVDPAYVRWVNPSDYRVAEQSCGGAECHQAIVETAPNSIMTSFCGHFNKTRYLAGAQDEKAAIYGVRDQVSPNPSGEEGTVDELTVLVAPPLTEESPMVDYLDHYLEKGCPRCHVWNFGNNDARGDFRSSGCAGCHMVYTDDGLSESADPVVNKDDPPHPQTHVLTTAIPDNQCEHCHYRGNRIGTMYRGVREQARLGDPEENLERSVETVHTREAGFYIYDEDTTNDIDETPPDLHQAAGLGCVDCHIGVDVHGDDQLYSAHDYQVGIECEDCHGTPEAPIQRGDDGLYRTTGGDVLELVYTNPEGEPVLTGRLSGETHPLTQLSDLQVSSANETLVSAHGRSESGVSHLDTLECYTCHTSWTQSCFGCHVTVDTRAEATSLLDGTTTPGWVGGTRSYVALDYFALGVGTDGKITPMAPQEKMFVTVIVDCDPETEECTEAVDSSRPGKRLFDQVPRTTTDGMSGMGFGPVVPHTTSSGVQPCDRCHTRSDGTNADILAETFGTGSGRVIIPDGTGHPHDLTQVADEHGQTLVGLGHEGTSLVDPELVEAMKAIEVDNSGLELRDFPEWEAP